MVKIDVLKKILWILFRDEGRFRVMINEIIV